MYIKFISFALFSILSVVHCVEDNKENRLIIEMYNELRDTVKSMGLNISINRGGLRIYGETRKMLVYGTTMIGYTDEAKLTDVPTRDSIILDIWATNDKTHSQFLVINTLTLTSIAQSYDRPYWKEYYCGFNDKESGLNVLFNLSYAGGRGVDLAEKIFDEIKWKRKNKMDPLVQVYPVQGE